MTDTDLEVLRLAGAFYRHEAVRLQHAKERFGLSPTAFWQRANALIDDPAATLAEPELTARLRRQRDRVARLKRAG